MKKRGKVVVVLLLAAMLVGMAPQATSTSESGEVWPPQAEHVIQPSDTYWKIAETYYGDGSLWSVLEVVNGWDRNALPSGATMKIPMPWILITGAFGGDWGGEIGGALALLEEPVTYSQYFGRELWCGMISSVPVCVTAVGVEQGNAMSAIQEIYTMFDVDPILVLHGGINGGFYEVGSSVIPKTACIVDKFYNYPVLAPQPYWVEEGDTACSLAENYGWSKTEIAILVERNPGKVSADCSVPIRVGTQLVGPRDEAWNDHFISRGVTVYTRDGQSESVNCFETPDDLYAIAVAAAEKMGYPMPPQEIVEYVTEAGRDPAGIAKVYYGEDQVLCAGGTFFASPLEAWRQIELYGCNGDDMETPFVYWAVASETNKLHQPPVVTFRTSSDPPIHNPGTPFVSATEYLADPEGAYELATSSLGPIFALPVVDYQSKAYANFIEAFISEWKAAIPWEW
ncbi:hypothetical protein AMJ51_01795 [Microgenomates bacterium DG_75]|nr:MAG: hypothetical protein AMJ51_01795 [Microgenomates bacterium DG_75]